MYKGNALNIYKKTQLLFMNIEIMYTLILHQIINEQLMFMNIEILYTLILHQLINVQQI